MKLNQLANAVIMVRPAAFGFNPETAASNAFQHQLDTDISSADMEEKARLEFDAMVEKLRSFNIEVIVIDDLPEPVKPDAVFPNNWFSTHADGTMILYPMMSEIRQHERENPVFEVLAKSYQTGDLIDLSYLEKKGQYLEGTGSIVFDHVKKVAFACVSPRTNHEALRLLCEEIGYTAEDFTALDSNGKEIYHTNVMLAIGNSTAIICTECIVDEVEREKVLKLLRKSGREIIKISMRQMEQFAGNMLNVANRDNLSCWIMSESALSVMNPEQLEVLKRDAEIIAVEVPTIEKLGGGSARCMLAECFLSRRN